MKSRLSGFRGWLLQRITALYLLGFILYFIVAALVAPPASFDAWRAWALSPGASVAMLLFFTALALHAWVGLRDVVVDYVKPPLLRLAVLAVLGGALAAHLIWAGSLLLA